MKNDDINKYVLTENEKDILRVLKYLKFINSENTDTIRNGIAEADKNINTSEEILKSLGYSTPSISSSKKRVRKKIDIVGNETWDQILEKAKSATNSDANFYDIFSEKELIENREFICQLNNEFNDMHKLDPIDYMICALAGILSSAMDVLLVGIPGPSKEGLKAGPMSNYIRDKFKEAIPSDMGERLEKKYRVPYDTVRNDLLKKHVEGLSSTYHRFHSLGHDPILGFIFGVHDIMNNKISTIDYLGKVVSQTAISGDRGQSIFEAIQSVLGHMASDVNTSMGLPAPLMSIFNLFQFGEIGSAKQKFSEIVRGMYYEGYDFVHFCSMTIPVMIIEVIVRTSYTLKRIKEGSLLKDSLPISLDHIKNPKLGTMLFISHSIATGINAGKVVITKNPLSINYPQWMSFAKYSMAQLSWLLIKKPELRNVYVDSIVDGNWYEFNKSVDKYWNISFNAE